MCRHWIQESCLRGAAKSDWIPGSKRSKKLEKSFPTGGWKRVTSRYDLPPSKYPLEESILDVDRLEEKKSTSQLGNLIDYNILRQNLQYESFQNTASPASLGKSKKSRATRQTARLASDPNSAPGVPLPEKPVSARRV